MNKRYINYKTIIFLISIFLTAFIGVMSGNYFINWKNSSVEAENLPPIIETNFTLASQFPIVNVIDNSGKEVTTKDFLNTSKTIIIFLTPGCEPCGRAISFWSSFENKIPLGFQIIGICLSDFESGSSYISEKGFPYSVYYDTSYSFSTEFEVNQFPNVMGLKENGEIVLLNRGLYGNFSPIDACNLIVNK